MSVLTLMQNGYHREIPFFGTQTLQSVLAEAGIAGDHPCGGKGLCGKCAVRLEGRVSEPNAAERKAGTRLRCQAVLLGDATVWLRDDAELTQIETVRHGCEAKAPMAGRFGAAVDIGTTTMALTLCRLSDGEVLATAARGNPQRAVAADVIGRIEAAMSGKLGALQEMVIRAIDDLLHQACQKAQIPAEQVDALVVTGNTTMLYLLTGKDPTPLSHAPFAADCLFGMSATVLERNAYLPPCMDAFVGADITCAVLESQMTVRPGPVLLCDIGTNGEIALWKNGKLYITSTAAGPAFEGAGISCGCGSIPGAIDRVWQEQGSVRCHTIENGKPVGLCGSGLIDALAVFLAREDIDETGAMDEDALTLAGEVCLTQKDIRAVQLAKAAIAAGIRTLLETTGTAEAEIARFYLCGGFGAHLNLESAVAIGLFPASFAPRAKVLGNGALAGALGLLLDRENISRAKQLAASACHVNLGGNPRFNENYVEQMLFPEI